jgi:hypothetical protein
MTVEAPGTENLGTESGRAELKMWGAVLDTLVRDGQSYWQGRRWRGADDLELEQAFDDLCRVGPMTRYCCALLDLDPDWISEGFISWCEDNMA